MPVRYFPYLAAFLLSATLAVPGQKAKPAPQPQPIETIPYRPEGPDSKCVHFSIKLIDEYSPFGEETRTDRVCPPDTPVLAETPSGWTRVRNTLAQAVAPQKLGQLAEKPPSETNDKDYMELIPLELEEPAPFQKSPGASCSLFPVFREVPEPPCINVTGTPDEKPAPKRLFHFA